MIMDSGQGSVKRKHRRRTGHGRHCPSETPSYLILWQQRLDYFRPAIWLTRCGVMPKTFATYFTGTFSA